jgi:hypothetical protein
VSMSCQETEGAGVLGREDCKRGILRIIYFVVYGLFNDIFIRSDYIAWNDRMVSE